MVASSQHPEPPATSSDPTRIIEVPPHAPTQILPRHPGTAYPGPTPASAQTQPNTGSDPRLSTPWQQQRVRGTNRGIVILLWSLLVGGATLAITAFAVFTARGQRLDDAVLLNRTENARVVELAWDNLGVISLGSLVLVTAILCTIAWGRRGLGFAVTLGAALVLTLLLAQLIKYGLNRPELSDSIPWKSHNTLPSGHSTIAAMMALAFLAILPQRMRGFFSLIAAGITALIPISTVAAGWHRPSDAIVAILFVAFMALLVSGLSLLTGTSTLYPRGTSTGGTPAFTLILLLISIGSALVAGFFFLQSRTALETTIQIADLDFSTTAQAFWGAMALIITTATATTALVLWFWRRVDFGFSVRQGSN